jgi:hypothetical protein
MKANENSKLAEKAFGNYVYSTECAFSFFSFVLLAELLCTNFTVPPALLNDLRINKHK